MEFRVKIHFDTESRISSTFKKLKATCIFPTLQNPLLQLPLSELKLSNYKLPDVPDVFNISIITLPKASTVLCEIEDSNDLICHVNGAGVGSNAVTPGVNGGGVGSNAVTPGVKGGGVSSGARISWGTEPGNGSWGVEILPMRRFSIAEV